MTTTLDNEDVISKVAYSIFESASLLLLEMDAVPTNAQYLSDGSLFSAVAGLEFLRNGITITRRTSPSSNVQRVIRKLKPYVNSFATAMLRALLVNIDKVVDECKRQVVEVVNDSILPKKILLASQVSLCNYASRRARCSPVVTVQAASAHNWLDVINGLLLHAHMNGNVRVNEPVYQAMKVRFSNNNTVFDVITMLVDDCNRLDAEDAALGRCDTDFMTLCTVMPMGTNEADDAAILDPSVSTTLKDRNDMIQRTFDTVPVIKRNKYFNALQNSNAVQTTVGVLNIAHVVQQCMSSSRTDKRFVELHRSTQGGSSELDRFFAQACSVSPRNLWLFLQCINFEMMDPETFGAMLYCLKVTNGIPTPDEREVAAYANSSLFRMAMNLFYHTRVCHSYKNDEVYLYDGMFFNHYLSWMHDVHYLEHHIPPSVAASIMSWCTSMSTALHTVRDADGTRQSMAALSICEIDQRVLADFLKMFVKMYIEDET
ncbi:uncharacterized protein ISCGN_030048 [Ixodes scapularis]